MNILYAIFPLCLSFSVAAEPLLNGNVLDSSGVVDELLSVTFSMSLTQAIKYYQSQDDIVLTPDAYAQTIKMVSDRLNMNLSPTRYSRLNGLSYASLFLNSNVVNINMFNADNLSSDYSEYPASLRWVSSLPSDAYYDGAYGNASLSDPLPLFSVKIVSPTLKSKGVARISQYASDDVYALRYNNGYIVGDTAQSVVDFYSEIYSDVAYSDIYHRYVEYESIQMNTYYSDGTKRYSGCTLSFDKKKELTPTGTYNNYSINGMSVYLNSTYKFEGNYEGRAVCYDTKNPDVPADRLFLFKPVSDKEIVSVNAPLYRPDEIENIVHSPFEGDETLLMSYSAAMRKTALAASAFSLLLNNAWATAAATENYSGVPYTSSLSVSSAAVTQVMNERSLQPTAADLFMQVKGGAIHLMQWDDTQNAYISNEMASKQESVKVDFGPNPGTQAPELDEGGTMDKILSPITSVLPFLQKFELTPHAVQCPVINIPFYDKSYSMDSFCILAEQNKKMIALFFVICWTMLGLIILVR